jgi:hypothetical protein
MVRALAVGQVRTPSRYLHHTDKQFQRIPQVGVR